MAFVKESWLEPLLNCTEIIFIVDEKTKEIVWSNDEKYKVGEYCYCAFLGKEKQCAGCPHMEENKLYQWDFYDEKNSHWYKTKSYLFSDNGRILRAENMNVIDDAMLLTHDSIEHISELQKLLTENARIRQRLQREASHDRMTGLFNRNQFNLDVASGDYNRGGTGVLYFDLNNLKKVNDTYRHEAGDRLILCLAEAVSKTAEVFENAAAYRVGGDEFVMLMSKCSVDDLQKAHQTFYQKLSQTKSELPCIVAMGEAFSKEDCDVEKLISEADQAMYADKLRLKQESGETMR